jgi:tetratricopeptide (TPR) repeat protein
VIPASGFLFRRAASNILYGFFLAILLAVLAGPRARGQSAANPGAAAPSAAAPSTHSAAAPSDESAPTGNEVCAKCHSKIFDTYSETAMARASGPATQDFLPGEFQHEVSGIHYRVYEENGDAWLSFERSGDADLHGKRKLLYFIGSGHRGRTFLFADDGFVFESPINYYAQKGVGTKGVWDMAPAFESAKEMPLNLPAAPSCLACHTSNAQAPVAGTENKYGVPLFAHSGITCERCHGAGAAHVSEMRTARENPSQTNTPRTKVSPATAAHANAPSANDTAHANEAVHATDAAHATSVGHANGAAIVNPAKLSPARRDAVCMQCHLEGNAAIEQPGRHLYQFQPGDDLSDFVRYFVLTGDGKENVRAVSQFEALAQSKCKRASGDAMSCTSCHDPHSSPTATEKVAFYRGKCLACHGEPFAAKHHVEQPDCAQCHMPRLATADVAHTQASDHRILRVPLMPLLGVGSPFDPSHAPPSEPKLVRFPAVAADESVRDLALGWVSLAGANSSFAFTEAGRLLEQAVQQTPEDPAILSALAYNEQRRGQIEQAREHYEHALRVDSLSIDAAANLAVLEANAGHLDKAIALWKPAFERAPQRVTLGLNLARGFCLNGNADLAQATLVRVLEFSPDLGAGRSMLKQLQSGQARCVVH